MMNEHVKSARFAHGILMISSMAIILFSLQPDQGTQFQKALNEANYINDLIPHFKEYEDWLQNKINQTVLKDGKRLHRIFTEAFAQVKFIKSTNKLTAEALIGIPKADWPEPNDSLESIYKKILGTQQIQVLIPEFENDDIMLSEIVRSLNEQYQKFTITKSTLQRLKSCGLPNAIISKIQELQGPEYGFAEFLERLENFPDSDQVIAARQIILSACEIAPSPIELANIDIRKSKRRFGRNPKTGVKTNLQLFDSELRYQLEFVTANGPPSIDDLPNVDVYFAPGNADCGHLSIKNWIETIPDLKKQLLSDNDNILMPNSICIWSQIKDLSIMEAQFVLQERKLLSREKLKLIWFDVRPDHSILAGDVVILLSLLYLITHLTNIRKLVVNKAIDLRDSSWVVLFSGFIANLLIISSIVAVPMVSISLLAWRSYELSFVMRACILSPVAVLTLFAYIDVFRLRRAVSHENG